MTGQIETEHVLGFTGRRRISRKGGSVLLPAVVAMLILMMAGVALVEVSSAQRSQTLLSGQATRAYWIAEAGLWHAALEGTALATPVSFDGGSYVVTGVAGSLSATGTLFDANQTVTYQPPSSSGTDEPLDVSASAASVTRINRFTARLDLVSLSNEDLEISSFALEGDEPQDAIRRIALTGNRLWRINAGVFLPTGVQALNDGSAVERTISSGSSPSLDLRFRWGPVGTNTYSLTLNFVGGLSSTIPFTVAW